METITNRPFGQTAVAREFCPETLADQQAPHLTYAR
jgi:hypothetical protein